MSRPKPPPIPDVIPTDPALQVPPRGKIVRQPARSVRWRAAVDAAYAAHAAYVNELLRLQEIQAEYRTWLATTPELSHTPMGLRLIAVCSIKLELPSIDPLVSAELVELPLGWGRD
jgi:hypothetical protein